jgi:hypothetical protein
MEHQPQINPNDEFEYCPLTSDGAKLSYEMEDFLDCIGNRAELYLSGNKEVESGFTNQEIILISCKNVARYILAGLEHPGNIFKNRYPYDDDY